MRGLILGMMVLAAGCAESPTPITTCDALPELIPDCRFHNPEDLVVAPGGGRLIVSQMGSMDGSEAGDLVLYTPDSRGGGDISLLFPDGAVRDDRRWGNPQCAPPDADAFSPHGIDLVQRADGGWMLAVVNHGGSESVELFEVAEDGQSVSLEWRGCARGPDQAAFNDVAATRSGGFYVSQMMPSDSQLSSLLKGGLLGSDTGFVYQWSPEGDYQKVAGSDGPFPNGVALSADERFLYINMYLGGEVRKLDLASGRVIATAEVASPDNSTWSADGRLLVASHIDGLYEGSRCQGLTAGSCGFAFRIVALEAGDLQATTILEHRGAPMGGATVAMEMNGDLYLGTFAGDRITRAVAAATAAADTEIRR